MIEEDYAHIHAFPWNDLDAFETLLRQHRGQVAGVIVTPFHHPAFGDSALPAPGFLKGVEAACRREGAVLILDDVRCGFRLHLGGSHRVFGFEPDLICFSKALANGYPLSAGAGPQGTRSARPGRSSSPVSSGTTPCRWPPRWRRSTCWSATTCPRTSPASARACARGCSASPPNTAAHPLHGHGRACRSCRSPTNAISSAARRFAARTIRRGVFFHPHHNWFLCAAHQTADIDEALAASDAAFEVVREEFPPTVSR